MSAYTKFDGTFSRVPGTDRYTASKVLIFDLGKPGSGYSIEVPPLYEHDVSIPRGLGWLFDRHDPRFQRAARLHDWLLDNGWDRVTAAGVFNAALAADGVPAGKRFAMTAAVAFYRWS